VRGAVGVVGVVVAAMHHETLEAGRFGRGRTVPRSDPGYWPTSIAGRRPVVPVLPS
jgi:hypothetical protein